ncbi:MAG: metal ABC transporter permease [Clostridia bacterium]|nr:metal ABC transporter permease [Clostridia bacterium]
MGRFLESLLSTQAKGHRGRRAAAIALAALIVIVVLLASFNFKSLAAAVQEAGLYLQYRFIQRALIVGVLVSLCAALLGVTLVLKRYSMIGDGLSHVGFGALSIAASLGFVTAQSLPDFLPQGLRGSIAGLCGAISASPLPFTLVVVIALAFLILRLNEGSSIRGDAAIALLSTGALAVGVLVTSLTSGMNVDVMNYMFGSILAMSSADVILSVSLSVVVLVLFVLFCNRIFAVTFDEPFARATGTRAGLYNMLIAILTAVTIVIGMRMMGTMLISSLIIFPALTSMRLFSRFRHVLISSAVISVLCFVIGIMLSCLYSIPAGAGIVLVNLCAFLVFSLVGRIRS